MKFVNRVLAAVLALGLIVLGALVVLEVVVQRVGSAPVLVKWTSAYTWGRTTTWDSSVIRIITIVMALVGLILLVAELKRPAVQRLPVAHAAPGVDIAYTRRGVAGAVRSAAGQVDGVRKASAVVGRRSVKVTATSAATEATAAKGLTGAVTDAVQRQVGALKLDPTPRIDVTVNPRRA